MAKFEVYYDEFKELWLRDDPDWVKSRKQLWKKVLANMERYHKGLGDANYKQQLTHYFVYGELLGYTDKIVRDFIVCDERVLCIPWSNREELEQVFNYKLHSATQKAEMMIRCPILLSHYLRDLPEQWPHLQLFCDVIYGNEYKEIKSPKPQGSNESKIISPEPSIIVENYILDVMDLISIENDNNFTWLNCSFDYFKSCVDYVVKHNIEVKEMALKFLFKCFKKLDTKKAKFGQYQQDVFDKIYPYMMSENAYPFIVDVREKIMS